MPIDFANMETVFKRAVNIWSWRKPQPGETPEQYREAAAQYVGLSDPEEADAIRNGKVFTKFDPTLVFKD